MLRKLEQRRLIVLPTARVIGNRARRIREMAHARDPIICGFEQLQPIEIAMVAGWGETDDRAVPAALMQLSRHGRWTVYLRGEPWSRSKKRQTRTGRHRGLVYMGFMDRCSGLLASSAVQTALLCPSFEIAQDTLGSFGIRLDIKTIYRLCMRLGQQGILHRQRIRLAETDRVQTRSLLVCIDRGRLRERSPKLGRRPAGRKRQGYHTDWREPTQVVIHWLNEQGRKCNETLPIYDATMADIDGVFQLLESYLAQIGPGNADFVIFCADGVRRYWRRITA